MQSKSPNNGWHLARTDQERHLAELEFSIEHAIQAFYRWKSACMATVSGEKLSGDDTAILNLIRMNEEPKGLSDIAGLLNRTDTSNIQYALRKLLKLGLIERLGSARRTARYQVSQAGLKATEDYATLRAQILSPLLERLAITDADMVSVAHLLDLLTSLYGQSTQTAALKGYGHDTASRQE